MSSNISEQRSVIRQQIRTARKALSINEQQHASLRLLNTLINHPKIQQAKRVSLTLAYDGEIDVMPFIHWCWQQKIQVYLPVVHPSQTGELLFLAYQQETEMIINRYGISEPRLLNDINKPNEFSNTCPARYLDIVFTPLVAFDKNGNRIGMGGGYYDRLLTPWFINKTGPYPIGLAHQCQQISHVPIQPWDVPLPEIITPEQHFHFK